MTFFSDRFPGLKEKILRRPWKKASTEGSTLATTKKQTRKVTIVVTNTIVGKYEARAYPDDDINDDGLIELYEVDLYTILIEGTDDNGNSQTFTHSAPRFMPYWNDPQSPHTKYPVKGWANSGLSAARTIVVKQYLKYYEVQNRFSPGKGAIVLKGAFYLHAGPADDKDCGFGSAGCIEIIGNFDTFKSNIQSLSGFSATQNADDSIEQLVKDKNLIVKMEKASVPDIKSKFTRAVSTLC